MKLELKYIAPYLPYGLGLYYNDTKKVYPLVVHNSTCSMQGGFNINEVINEPLLKPILRPMSDLNIKSLPNIPEPKNMSPAVIFNDRTIEMCYWQEYEFLFKHHFDVFGLIEEGLAIDINTIENV